MLKGRPLNQFDSRRLHHLTCFPDRTLPCRQSPSPQCLQNFPNPSPDPAAQSPGRSRSDSGACTATSSLPVIHGNASLTRTAPDLPLLGPCSALPPLTPAPTVCRHRRQSRSQQQNSRRFRNHRHRFRNRTDPVQLKHEIVVVPIRDVKRKIFPG